MKKRGALLLMLCVLTVSCGSAEESPAGAGPEVPVSSTPGSEPLPNDGPQRVEPRDGLVDIRPTVFDRQVTHEKGTALDLFFWSGIEECYGVDRIEVEYSRKAVTATIFEGREPKAEACIELAVRKVVRVKLSEPLGDRTVVDGGTTP